MTAKLIAAADGLSGSLAVGANEAFQFKPVAGGLELSQDGIIFQTVDTNGKVAFPQTPRVYLPGEIIQQLMFTDAGGNMTGSLANITQSVKSITPKSTNSTIFVSVSFYGYPNESGTYFNVQIRRTTQTAALIGSAISLGLTTAAAQAVFAGIVQAYQSNSATDVISFQLWGQNASGAGGTINVLTFTITEVQN